MEAFILNSLFKCLLWMTAEINLISFIYLYKFFFILTTGFHKLWLVQGFCGHNVQDKQVEKFCDLSEPHF